MGFAPHLRMLHHLLQRLGVRHTQLVGVEDVGDDAGPIEVASGAAGHVIHKLTLVMPSDDVLQLLDRLRNWARRIHVDGKSDDEVVTRHPADAFHDGAREAHAVLEAAAPFVVAAVVEGQPELVDDGIIGREQLDAVEACLFGPPCRLHEAFDDLLDFHLDHGVAAIRVVEGG